MFYKTSPKMNEKLKEIKNIEKIINFEGKQNNLKN